MRDDVVDERLHAPDPRTERGAGSGREVGRHLQFRVAQRLTRGRDRELGEAIGATDLLAVHVIEWIEVLDLARDLRVEAGRIEARDRTDPALAFDEAPPGLLHRRAEWSDEPDARHDDAPAIAARHASSLKKSLTRPEVRRSAMFP